MRRRYRRKKCIIMLSIVLVFLISGTLFMNEVFFVRKSNTSQQSTVLLIDKKMLLNFRWYIERGRDMIRHESNKKINFNLNKSDKIGGFRILPDLKFESCRTNVYALPDDITVSVIITYYNEARSTLLRTIVSVLRRTSVQFLNEIIVVDDFNSEISQGIDLQFLPLIKLIRNPKRFGVIESRNVGANLAKGDYVVFLDSHCEVNEGWLEPLLHRLYLYPGTAVSPVLDIIDAKTFQYSLSRSYLKGGFDWKLNFNWIPMSEEEREARYRSGNEMSPFASPVFSGGILMMPKSWFQTLRGFNSILKVWGGESIELSIKHWLCGGQIEIVPCSRVGHVFMQEHSFDFNRGANSDVYLSNVKAIADSWLDEYKHYFYSLKPNAITLPNFDLNAIRTLKADLKCRPFSWYLQIVFPELKLPNAEYIAFGRLQCGNKCLSVRKRTTQNSKSLPVNRTKFQLTMEDCHDEDITNWYLHSTTGKLSTKSGTECLNVGRNSETVVVETCISNRSNNNISHVDATMSSEAYNTNAIVAWHGKIESQQWIRSGENLIHKDSQLCLDNFNKDAITVSLCRRGNPSQLFSFSVELQRL